MMSDAIDDALDNDEAEEETEDLTNQVNSLKLLLPFLSFLGNITPDALALTICSQLIVIV